MFDDFCRSLKDRLLGPVARALGPRLPPDAITWLAFAAGLSCAGAVLNGDLRAALGLWLLNRLLDGLDGTHARVHARVSDFGAYLDIVLDFIVYAAIPIAFVLAARQYELALAGVFLLASFYVNAASWMYLSALLEARREGAASRGETTSATMPPGIIAGTETIVFYVLFFLMPARLATLFTLMAILVLANVAMRLYWANRRLRLDPPSAHH
ncbi:MAG TPA: CDP-alcohol phosphatidyltransferase family protein [Vicinamibacterales bacterium]|jgi:phosphatidylglycerophosphate synthase|nr:CDP-alcohol phosphatidyltransferase family protein [Vicinamibacterales bacterium]